MDSEGYADNTAGKAFRNVNRERRRKERAEHMAKKKSCRRTEDENKIHEKAVKMRKMTDDQLVHYVEDRVEKARSEGFNQGKQRDVPRIDISAIVNDIGDIRGIGAVKLTEIKAVLKRRLEVYDG